MADNLNKLLKNDVKKPVKVFKKESYSRVPEESCPWVGSLGAVEQAGWAAPF